MKNAPDNPKAEGSAGDTCDSDIQAELFNMEALPLAPTLPNRGTLADELLGVLLAGERVEQPEWLTRTRSWRLAATVGQLGDMGWPVQALLIPAPNKRNERRKIARYYLKPDAIAAGLSMYRRGKHEAR